MYTSPLFAPMAYPQIAIASTTECGSPSRIALSMKAPGSPSSALQTTYFWSDLLFNANCHFNPVENPPPPRPLSPESFIISTTSWLVILTAFSRALYP